MWTVQFETMASEHNLYLTLALCDDDCYQDPGQWSVETMLGNITQGGGS